MALHSEEVKAVALAALLEGQSVRQVAKAHSLPSSTVGRWRSEIGGETRAAFDSERAARIGDLVIGNLEAMLRATTEMIQVVSQDKEWLKRQSASELAVFIGVISDKAYRILEGLPEPDATADDISGVHPEGQP